MSAPEVTVDVRVENHGTLFLFDLLTDEAVAWVVDVEHGPIFPGGGTP